MLLVTGTLTIVVLLILILTKKTTALTALILVPIMGALAVGFGLETAEFAVAGIRNIAPVAAMFIFAILFFGVLTDAGMFDPIIDGILRMVGNDPAKIVVGAAILSMIVHLDAGTMNMLFTIVR
jgi:CitMHS family citrate-Mg2+:H+ or citrate-Ca2+:H+ symporter